MCVCVCVGGGDGNLANLNHSQYIAIYAAQNAHCMDGQGTQQHLGLFPDQFEISQMGQGMRLKTVDLYSNQAPCQSNKKKLSRVQLCLALP